MFSKTIVRGVFLVGLCLLVVGLVSSFFNV